MQIKKNDLSKPVSECVRQVGTVLNINDTIEEALPKIREIEVSEKIVYFYALDDEGRLIGVVPTRQLILSKPSTKIKDIVKHSIIRIRTHQTLEDAMEVFERHRLLALPVVDDKEKFVGTIDVQFYVEESFDVADSRHRRDMFQLLGLSLEEGKPISVIKHYRYRMPWLFCNMISGFVCAIIANVNELVLNQFLLLAMFIPLVLTLSESVSMQSMTQSLQFLKRPRISMSYALMNAFKEWKIVWLVAVTSAFIVGTVSLFWGDGFMPSLIIGSGILISVTLSAAFGIVFPVFLHKTNLDPKVASGPVVLMLADALTTFIYLSLATWILL